MKVKKIPVIFDTDIGGDIEDTWALAFLLKRPELDLKLITTVTAQPMYRAKLAAKLCDIAGQPDIPIGLGFAGNTVGDQADWIEDYDIAAHHGKVFEDGVGELVRLVMESEEPITIIAVGPCPNLAEAVRREPKVGERAKVIAMFGAIYRGYWGGPPKGECNACSYPADSKVFLEGYKNIELCPLDTCFDIVFDGARYQRLSDARKSNALVDAVLTNFEIWGSRRERWSKTSFDYSSELCDILAVYMAYSKVGLEMERLTISIDNKGIIKPSTPGVPVAAAVRWTDMYGVFNHIIDSLLS